MEQDIIGIADAVPLSRRGEDYCGPTVLVDLALFVYAIFMYPETVSSSVEELAESGGACSRGK